MHVAGDFALVAVIQVDVTCGGDEQFVHGAVDQFAAEDVTKGVDGGGQLNGDDKVNGLKQPLVKGEARVQ